MAPSPAIAPAEWRPDGRPLSDQSGVLLRRVGSRLNKEHHTIAQVSAELLSLGAEVDRAEEQLLGRVLTTQDARDLVNKHKKLDVTNGVSRDALRRLNEKIDTLGSELSKAHQTQLVNVDAQHAREHHLEEEIAKQQARLRILRSDSRMISTLEANRTELLHTHQALVDKGSQTVRRHDDIKKLLSQVKASIQKEIAEEARLKQVLEEVHQYGVMCHARAKELQVDIAQAAEKVVTRSAADVATEEHNNAVSKANTQRIQAEAALLRAEVRRVEDSGAAGIRALTERREELHALEWSIVNEVKNLTARMATAKQRAAQLQLEAEHAQGSENEHLAEMRALEKTIRDLSKRVSPVVYAALEAENNALHQELAQATSLLTMSKTSEARAFAAKQQVDAEVEGQRGTAKAAAEDAQAAGEEGQRQLSAAVKEASSNKAKAEALLAKAMGVVEARCKPKWDKRKKEKDSEIAVCRQLEEEYAVVAAQEETLKQTLQAQQTASAADNGEDMTP
jgi:hypothetical protein